MSDCQLETTIDIRIQLLKKKKSQKDLIPLLKEKYPNMDIQEPHISMALNDKYPPMLDKIREVVGDI